MDITGKKIKLINIEFIKANLKTFIEFEDGDWMEITGDDEELAYNSDKLLGYAKPGTNEIWDAAVQFRDLLVKVIGEQFDDMRSKLQRKLQEDLDLSTEDAGKVVKLAEDLISVREKIDGLEGLFKFLQQEETSE